MFPEPSKEVHHAPQTICPSRARRCRAVSAAADIAAALGARAEAVCRRYLPQGRKQGRYWVAGNLDGARGHSLFIRLTGPGVPGKWTDGATGEHGDLIDLIRYRTGAPTLRAALIEARAFLALPASKAATVPYDATEAARHLWRRCRAIDGTHAEAYLRARGLARCRFPALRFHPELFYRDGAAQPGPVRRLPALIAAVTGDDDVIHGVQRTWLDPRAPTKADVANPRKALGRIFRHAVRFGSQAGDAAASNGKTSLLVGEGSRPCSLLSPHCRISRLRPRFRPEVSAHSRRLPVLRPSSSLATTILKVRVPPHASHGVAHGRVLPPPSLFPSRPTSTMISLPSAPQHSVPGWLICFAPRCRAERRSDLARVAPRQRRRQCQCRQAAAPSLHIQHRASRNRRRGPCLWKQLTPDVSG